MKKLWLGLVAAAALAALPFACSGSTNNTDGGTGGGTTGTGGGTTGTGGGTTGTGGGTTGTGGGTTGTGGGTAMGGGTGTGGGSSECETCNNLVPGGSVITQMYSSATPPTAQGGVLAAGTYHLTAMTQYVTDGGSGPVPNMSQQATINFNFPNLELVDTQDDQSDAGCMYHRTSGTIVQVGSNITLTTSCPVGCTDCGGTVGYTVSGNDLIIFNGPTTTQTVNKQ